MNPYKPRPPATPTPKARFLRHHKCHQLPLLDACIQPRVAVLGAGIQGTTSALLFRKYHHSVALIDQADDVLTRASANQAPPPLPDYPY